MKLAITKIISVAVIALPAFICAADPILLQSRFNLDEVEWIKDKGNSSISGTAFLQLNEDEQKGCAGFNVELLPVAKYSNERILKTYGNNIQGQVLVKDNPPTFTPDSTQYHELVRKSQCDEKNQFIFDSLPAGHYYVMVFIVWKDDRNQNNGGALMKKVILNAGENQRIKLGLK